MTDERKTRISTEMKIAMNEEVISGASLAKLFNISPAYISNIQYTEKHHLVPVKVWEMFDEWRISGEELRTFGVCQDNASVKVPPIPQETRDALQDEIDKMETVLFPKRDEFVEPDETQMQKAVQETPPLMARLRDILTELEELGFQPHFTLDWREEI